MAAHSSSISSTNVTLLVEVPTTFIEDEKFSLVCSSVSANYNGYVPVEQQFNFAKHTTSHTLEKNKFSPYADMSGTCFSYFCINSTSLSHPKLESLRVVICACLDRGHTSDRLTKTITYPPERLGTLSLTFIGSKDKPSRWDFIINKNNSETPDRSIFSSRIVARVLNSTHELRPLSYRPNLPAVSLEFKINEIDFLDPDLSLSLLVTPLFKEKTSKDYSHIKNHTIDLKAKRYLRCPSHSAQPQLVALIKVSSLVFSERLEYVDLSFDATRNPTSLDEKNAFKTSVNRRVHPSNLTHISVEYTINETGHPSFFFAPPHDLDYMPLPPPSLQLPLPPTPE